LAPNDTARVPGAVGYAEQAAALAPQYDGRSFADVYRPVLSLIPNGPGRALDIGAGTGRDAAALAARGFQVTAVEPTAEFRTFGQRAHAESAIAWVDDSLPDLARLIAAAQQFDFILSMAVWMHLDEGERRRAMPVLAGLLAPGGRMILSLRHGPVPAGRRMFDVAPAEIIDLATAVGLGFLHQAGRGDMMGRDDVRWTFLVFQRGPAA
jgi:SAM-dependent methyltransferase